MAALTKAQKAEKAILAKAIEISTLTAGEFNALSDEEKQSFIDKAKLAVDPDADLDDDGDAQLQQAIENAAKVNGTAKVPGYAAGGSFGGGLRLVGENGPELEVTGPSRIYNANQTAAMLGGGGDSGATAAEVRALREEIKSNASYMAKLTKELADGIDTLVNSGVQINGTVATKAAA